MKIIIVDNGGQWTHREWRVVRDLGAESVMMPNTTPLEEIDADGVVRAQCGGSDVAEAVAAALDRIKSGGKPK